MSWQLQSFHSDQCDQSYELNMKKKKQPQQQQQHECAALKLTQKYFMGKKKVKINNGQEQLKK